MAQLFSLGSMSAILQFLSRRLPKKFRSRSEARSAWVSRYSDLEWSRVEHFLVLFCDAFLLQRAGVPHLYPDDKPMEIYREIFRFWPVDDCQFEHLQQALAREYRLEIPPTDFEHLTLGDLYERVRYAA